MGGSAKVSYAKELLAVLRRANYDDRAQPIGQRNRDIAGAALEVLTKRTNDSKIVRWALKQLPAKEIL